jgi:hypothetical protein
LADVWLESSSQRGAEMRIDGIITTMDGVNGVLSVFLREKPAFSSPIKMIPWIYAFDLFPSIAL